MSVPAYRPTVAEIAAILRARTKDTSGNEVGTFTDDTRPTNTEIESLITNSIYHVEAQAGGMVCSADKLTDGAKVLTVLWTAMLVETSYFPEQVRADKSAWPEYKQMYDSILLWFRDANAACLEAEEGGVIPGVSTTISYYFQQLPPKIGLETSW